MDNDLIWLITGFLLIIAEVLTGTFYLLVLGLAAFAGGLVAYAQLGFPAQAIAAAAIAVAGVLWVNRIRGKSAMAQMRPIDAGQPATFECWVNQSAGHARVRYRDALWDATVIGEAAGETGEIFYVTSADGSTLKVSKTRPA